MFVSTPSERYLCLLYCAMWLTLLSQIMSMCIYRQDACAHEYVTETSLVREQAAGPWVDLLTASPTWLLFAC